MNAGRAVVGIAITLAMLMHPPSIAGAGESNPADGSSPSLAERLDRLENRMTELEAQVVTLKREKMEAQQDFKRQKEANTALKAQLERQTASASAHLTSKAAADPVEDEGRHRLVDSWGVRAGYQGFPFGQHEGGFFYGVYLDHLLLAENEGIPGGDLDLEVGAGVGTSGNDQVTVKSTVVGAPTNVDLRQRMISVWPGLKYKYDLWKSYGFVPYVTGGPGIWVDIVETPPLVGGLQFPTKQLAARKLPATAAASLYQGAQGGAGFEYSLAGLKYEIFQRMKVGFDYRYAAWTTGQRFSTYSLLLTYSD